MTAMDKLSKLMHRGRDEAPWVAFDDGIQVRMPHIDVEGGIFVMNSRSQPGYLGRLHRHSGDVFAVTTAGAWRYLEHPEINRPGSYLYEPDGSSHTFKVLDDNDGVTEFWAIVQGALEYLDEQGEVVSVLDAAAAEKFYSEACEREGHKAPERLGA